MTDDTDGPNLGHPYPDDDEPDDGDIWDELDQLATIYAANCAERGAVALPEDIARVGELALATRLENTMIDMVLDGRMTVDLKGDELVFGHTAEGMKAAKEWGRERPR